ncbi:MAG: ribonuclease III [Clostridia bacterium]|nr:ribonuclease III [Clostridia bacterium]
MDFERLRRLEELQRELGYTFKNMELLDTALTHTSYVKGDGNGSEHNERLEFLGDAVLELCVSEKLYKEYPDLNEGVMTRVRALCVCEGALHRAAGRLGLGRFLLLSHGEEHSGGREKPSILADAVEAVIGAVFLDGGISPARELVLRVSEGSIEQAVQNVNTKDYKTMLQEHVQKKHLGNVTYELVDASGPDHMRVFTLQAMIAGEKKGIGSGNSKQEAGQQAARATLIQLGLV